MIIWGWRGLTSAVERHSFYCPQCNVQRNGTLKQVRNFFTLYFIPLIPLNVAGRFVQCDSCAGTFGEEILTYDPEQAAQENQMQMLRVMVMAALADGMVDDDERREINRQYQEFAGLPLSSQVLEEEIRLAMSSGANLNSFVAGFANDLTGHSKVLVIKLAFDTMSASGNLKPGHQEQLAQLRKTLGISEDQYMQVIEQLSQPDVEA